MKLALNGATIMHSPLADDVEIAAESRIRRARSVGRQAGCVSGGPPARRTGRADAGSRHPAVVHQLHREHHAPRRKPAAAEIMEQLRRTAGIARAIGAPSIVVVPGTAPTASVAASPSPTPSTCCAQMSDVAGDVGLAFEFLGKPGCSVPTLDMAIEIVTRGRPPERRHGHRYVPLPRGRQPRSRSRARADRQALRRPPERLRGSPERRS